MDYTGGEVVCGMTGVGLDLLEIDRLERALRRRPNLAARLFTAGELAFAGQRYEPARHLAVRFCAKEAVAKALAQRAAELGVDVTVSLTHSKGMAGAVALLR